MSNRLSNNAIAPFDSPVLFDWGWRLYTTASQRQGLLGIMQVAGEQHLPLVPLLRQWAEDERGVQRKRLQRVISLLDAGRPLVDAIEEVPGVVLPQDLLAIRLDAQLGMQTAAQRANLKYNYAISPAKISIRQTLRYFFFVILLSAPFVAFIMISISPVIAKILGDMGKPKPTAMILQELLAGFFASGGWILVLALLLVGGWLFATRHGQMVRAMLLGKRWQPLYASRIADILQHLAIVIRTGRPLAAALSTIARYHYDPVLRHDLLVVSNEVADDADVWSNMANVGLLSAAEAELMQTSERRGNRAWILEQLAAARRSRIQQRDQRRANWIRPAIVLLLAAVVLVQASIVWIPIVKLIQGIA